MTRQELLANIPLFESLTPEDLDALARRIEDAQYNDGDVIFQQGDEGSSLFLIDDGAVEISYGEGKGRVVLATLFPGQYFGELSLFDRAPRSATATATKASRLMRLDRDDVAAGGLVRAGPRPDVDDGARVAERGEDPLGDPRILAAEARVAVADRVVARFHGRIVSAS